MKKIGQLTFILMSALILFACTATDNTIPPNPLEDFTQTLNVQTLWSAQPTSGGTQTYLRLTPAVNAKQVFVDGYNGEVVSLDSQTGQEIWRVDLNINLTSGVAILGNAIYLVSESGEVYALSVKDGSTIWETSVSSEVLATPTAIGGAVYVKSIDGALTAFSASDGRQLWRYTQPVPSLILHEESQPVIAGHYVVVGFANGKLAVINRQTGHALWARAVSEPQGATDVERMVDIDMSPVVVNGVVYVATYQGYIAAFELQSGKMLWRHKISSYTGIAADAGRLYISDAQSYLWSFAQSSGAVAWRQTHLLGREITGPVLLGNNVLVADGYGYVHWMNKSSGQFVARSSVEDPVNIDPVVYGNVAYIYTVNGGLYAFK